MNRKLKAQIILKYGSQCDFARTLRLPENLVSRVIQGRQKLNPGSAALWARKLDVSSPAELGLEIVEIEPVELG